MIRKRLVERRSSPEDGRVREIYLTSNGNQLKNELIPIAISVLGQSLSGVETDDLATTLSVLSQFEQNLLAIE